MKAFVLFWISIAAFAQIPHPDVRNAKWDSRVFSGDWPLTLHSKPPAWFGYAITTVKNNGDSCCWNGEGRGGCGLEENRGGQYYGVTPSSPVPLEGSEAAAILLRVENNAVGKIRLYSLRCPLDAGGLPFTWLSGVSSAASIAYFKKLVVNSEEMADTAIFVMAQHASPEADAALAELAQATQPERIREKVAFWLGASREASGVAVLKNMLANDPSPNVRDKAVFALSISKQGEALNTLIAAAKSDRSPHVRGQALFWLAQKAGQRAASIIQNAAENDPDTEVKKSAIFALWQLPKEEGVPKLIEIARTQKNPEARKQAFFWLGQSQDPRALAFFQEILSK